MIYSESLEYQSLPLSVHAVFSISRAISRSIISSRLSSVSWKLEAIIPWKTFLELIQPSYYKGKLGNKPYPLELMLRIFILQNVYNLADMAVMNEVIDSRAFSNFCGINSPSEVPDGDTIGRFRNILTRNGLQEKIFAAVVKILMERKLILKKGTIVDSTFIESPSATKKPGKET
jgi:IS5 family transposase